MKKTQGQKRKRIVRVVVLALFFSTTGLGVFTFQNIIGDARSWVGIHEPAQSTVLTQEQHHDPGDKERIGTTTSVVVAIISIVPVTTGIALLLNFLLSFLFVRESRTKLNEGFYTEDSWLDVDENKLVLLTDNRVVVATLKARQVKPVTKAYQNAASHKQLIAMFKADQLKALVLDNITALHSRHDEHLILLAEGEKEINLSFLNIATKAHALKRLEARLPDTLARTKINRSRLRAAMPRLVVLSLLASLGYSAGNAGIWFVIGFISLAFIVPNLIRRLISPTVVTTFKQKSALPASDIKKAVKPCSPVSSTFVVAKAA